MLRSSIARIRLVTSASSLDTGILAWEFPTLVIERAHAARVNDAIVDATEWRTATSFRPFDDTIDRACGDAIMVRGDGNIVFVACETLTRYQRFIDRRNARSRVPLFERVLMAHHLLHDQRKPLVKADRDHALDTWHWVLRLSADASFAVQLAALFHDIERLESESDARVEHRAANYQAFKDAHARRGGDRTYDVLRAAGVDTPTAVRVRDIVAHHERRGADPEVDLINDADALSFFSLSSSGYLDYFGPEQTRRKIAYTLGRLGTSARRKLALVRLRPDVRALFQQAAA